MSGKTGFSPQAACAALAANGVVERETRNVKHEMLGCTPRARYGRRATVLFLLLLFAFGGTSRLHAQEDQSGMLGIRPHATYHFGDIDSVDMLSGNVTVKIPLYSLPQRGDLNLNYSLVLNAGGWASYAAWYKRLYYGFVPVLDGDVFNDAVAGLSSVNCIPPWSGSDGQCGSSPGEKQGLRDSTGAFHVSGNPIDGSDYNLVNYVITRPDGVGIESVPPTLNYAISNGFTDTNGNQIARYLVYTGTTTVVPATNIPYMPILNTYTPTNPSPVTEMITDSLGRTFPDISVTPPLMFEGWQVNNQITNAACPTVPTVATQWGPVPQPPSTSSLTWDPPGANGGTEHFIFCFAEYWAEDEAEGLEPNYALQSVVLPTNPPTYWEFSYDDTTNSLIEIRYPSGATIDYTYQYRRDAGDVPPANYPFDFQVTSRTLTDSNRCDPTGRCDSGTYYYNYPCYDGSCMYNDGIWSYMTDPAGNDTVVNFGQEVDYGSYLETSRTIYNGSYTAGNVLRTTTTAYENPSNGGPSYVAGAYEHKAVTTTLDDGEATTTSYTYDPGSTKQNSTTITAYDNSTVIQKTTTQYLWEAFSAYQSVNILDRVYSSTVADGSGNVSAETLFGYDESPSPAGALGNQTSVHRCAGFSGTSCTNWIVTSKVYNGNGMVIQSTDANGNNTTRDYDSTGAFLKDVIYPSTTAAAGAHKESFTFDRNTGEATSHTGENGEVTFYGYDGLGRITSTIYPPGGGSAGNTYYDTVPPSMSSTRTLDASRTLMAQTRFDELIQTTDKELASDPQGADYTESYYDTFGRVIATSNPYRAGGDTSHGNTSGYTETYYDALGRVTQVVRPDGQSVNTSYTGPCTTVADEAKRSRTSCTDAVGRVTEVTEDPGGLGFVTDYRYDAVGNLVCVDQQGGFSGGAGCDAGSGYGGTWRVRLFTYDSLSRLVTAQNPESGTINYHYDANSNVTSRTDANGITTTYCYDQLNRLTGKGYNGSCTAVKYGYDVPDPALKDAVKPTMGRRTTMDDASGHTFWNYDLMGRMTREQRSVNVPGGPPMSYSVLYTYNFDGTVSSIAYPSGRVVSYVYDNAGHNTQVSKNDIFGSGQQLDYVSGATYMPDGQIAQLTLGTASNCAGFGGATGEFSYNNRLQPVHMLYTTGTPQMSEIGPAAATSCGSSSGEFFHRMYSFYDANNNNNGNVSSVANCLDSTRTQSYSYDNLNRIASASTNGSDWGESYTIDPWGNLTEIDGMSGKQFYEGLELGAATSRNQLQNYIYDYAGNLTNDGAHRYQYDQENRIATVDGGMAAYTYDGDGQRVIKSLWGGGGTLYWYGTGGEILTESDLTGYLKSEYVYFNGKRLARTDNPTDPATAQLRYYFSDHLGSTSMVMDETFTSIEEDTDYYPYGGVANETGLGDSNHFKFTGKERDAETGNDYFGARYYASNMGRMMTPDPVGGTLGDPQSLNKYAYVRNSPLILTDPTGLDDFDEIPDLDQDDKDTRRDQWNQLVLDFNQAVRDKECDGGKKSSCSGDGRGGVNWVNATGSSPFEFQFSGNLYGEDYTKSFETWDAYAEWRTGIAADAGTAGEVYQAFMASCAYMSGCDPNLKYTVNSQRRGTTQNIQILGPDGKPLPLNTDQAAADAGHMGVGHGGNDSWYIGGMVDVLHVVDVQQAYESATPGGEAHIDPASPFGLLAPFHGVEFVLSKIVPNGSPQSFACSASGCH